MADGQVVFEITGDRKKVIASLKETTEAIQKETKKWDSAADKSAANIEQSFSGAVKKIVAGISAAKVGKALLDWGKAAIDAASDLAEVQNVVDTTFGEGAKQIESWSKTAGKQFGLTETQAKRFSSTIGAMMKSSGVAGDEIVEMSTSLAGLAADMASFYNLDFETAFQKIRSGISGETEPLKQLGINMSVANLEAFALEKGITKAFSAMSQSEQTLLRYQYLMKATADAQGDFQRTSDGFANASRRVEAALDTISTKGGQVLMTIVEPLTTGLASFLETITATPEETLFDKINNIKVDTDSKLAEIQRVAEEAQGLINQLNIISGTDAGEAIGKLAEGANKLDSSSPNTWKAVFGALKGVDGLSNIFSDSSSAGNVEALANAISGANLDTDKAEAWKAFLGALSENAGALTDLTGLSESGTKEWLEGIAEAVNSIDASDADAWDKLLSTLVSGFATDTPEGKRFVEGLAAQFLAMGTDSETAAKGLEALGFTSDQIADKQSEWLKVCKDLTQTIPGLNEVINAETGEVKGGIGALNDYVEEWKTSQEKLVYWKAFYAKKSALAETQGNLYSMRTEAGGAQYALDQFIANNPKIADLYNSAGGAQAVMREGGKAGQEFLALWENAKNAQDKYNTALEQSNALTEQLANEEAWLEATYGAAEEAAKEAAGAVGDFGGKTASEWNTITEAVNETVKALADYVQSVHDATQASVNSTLSGFDKIETAEKQYKDAANAAKELREELKKTGKYTDTEIEIKVNAENAQTTLKGLADGLKSQLAYIEEYQANLQRARDLGVSDEILSSLSDGSQESAKQLYAITEAYKNWSGQGVPEDIAELNALYKQVNESKAAFTDDLTQQKLTVDQTYQAMVEKAKSSIAEMNLGDEAASAMGDTVAGLATGISEHVGEVQAAVDSILAELNRLNGFGINIDLGSFGSIGFSIGNLLDGEHETGLDYVPFDGYLAGLHEGEGILTAEENRIWQRFKNGGDTSRNVDYDALGSTMRDNIKPGGNVYLDGRVVGSVVSQMQGNQYRSLQRSGWQQ